MAIIRRIRSWWSRRRSTPEHIEEAIGREVTADFAAGMRRDVAMINTVDFWEMVRRLNARVEAGGCVNIITAVGIIRVESDPDAPRGVVGYR